MRNTILSVMAVCGSHFMYGQGVGINTLKPDPSAALDIVSDNKGLLIPRVELKSLNDGKTIDKPAHSLLVYNVNAKLPGGDGYYFNAGMEDNPSWKKIIAGGGEDVVFKAAGVKPGAGSLVPGVPTDIQFANTSYNYGDHFKFTSTKTYFKVPEDGVYHFDVQTATTDVGADVGYFWYARIMRDSNGSVDTLSARHSIADQQISTDASLNKADEIYIQVFIPAYQGFPNKELNNQTHKTMFSGRLIRKK